MSKSEEQQQSQDLEREIERDREYWFLIQDAEMEDANYDTHGGYYHATPSQFAEMKRMAEGGPR